MVTITTTWLPQQLHGYHNNYMVTTQTLRHNVYKNGVSQGTALN